MKRKNVVEVEFSGRLDMRSVRAGAVQTHFLYFGAFAQTCPEMTAQSCPNEVEICQKAMSGSLGATFRGVRNIDVFRVRYGRL